MSAIANTFKTYAAKGIREDLSDMIYDISPTETPFLSAIGKGDSVDNTLFEWQTDALAAPNTANNFPEGDDVTAFAAVTPTVRLQNYQQISRKELIVAGTLEATKRAGRKSEEGYQMARRALELKRDMEAILLANQAASAVDNRLTASMLAFIKTNTDFGATGANPVYTTLPSATRTDGTARALTETQLKGVLATGWTNGADFDFLMVGASNKSVVSGFAGIATKTYFQDSAKKAAIIASADVYVGEFHRLDVIPNRWMRARDAILADPTYASVRYLRPFKREKLAKTGDAEKRMLIVEWGLEVKNEKAFGGIFDLL